MNKNVFGLFVFLVLMNSIFLTSGAYSINSYLKEETCLIKIQCIDEGVVIDNKLPKYVNIDSENSAPNIPRKPNGPTSGVVGILYKYSTNTTDPDNDLIKYGWSCNGGHSICGWSPYYYSGALCSVEIGFIYPGTYYICVLAEDEHGAQSNFSIPLKVEISESENYPPYTPKMPDGPELGKINELYYYLTNTTDPDNDHLIYGWDWNGDDIVDYWTGLYDSGVICNVSHSWSSEGTYFIKVKAKDTYGEESDYSAQLAVIISDVNYAPNKPSKPSGKIHCRAEISYSYESNTTDDEGDFIYYMFDWDDGSTSGWQGPFKSGSPIAISHKWSARGSYQIKVKAKDDPNRDGDLSDGKESVWSDPLPISVPKNKTHSQFYHQFISWIVNRFPLFEKILKIN